MGIEKTPLRIPAEWDPIWFEQFVRDALFLMDVRNGIEGTGITIAGSASEKVTLSASGGLADIVALDPTDDNFIVGDGSNWTLETPLQALASLGAAALTTGTWTPVLEGTSTPGTQSYTTQTGRYIKLDKLVAAWFHITLSAVDAGIAGNVNITGLPSTTAAASYQGALIAALWSNINISANYTFLGGVSLGSSDELQLIECGDNQAANNVVAAAITSTTQIRGCFIYEAA